jgi:two-component system, cell cycle sensor histidine kinase and response regulator CckA
MQEVGRRLLNAVADAIVIVDPAGEIEFVNDQAELLFGYQRADIVGQPIEVLIPEQHRKPHQDHRATYREQPRTRHMGAAMNTNGRRKDGSEFVADISLAPLKTRSGTSVIAAVRDVTEARRERDGLAALYEIAVQSGGLVDPAALGGLVVDRARSLLGGLDAVLLWWQPKRARLTVLADNSDKPFGRNLRAGEGAAGIAFKSGERVVIEDYPKWEHAAKDALARNMRSVIAVPLRARDQLVGALTVSFSTVRRFRDDELRIVDLLAAQVAPVLEAAVLYEALRAMHDYQAVFEHSPDPMWVEDFKTMAILAVNEPALKRYGYSRDEFLTITATDLRPPEEVPAFLEMLAAVPADKPYSRSTVHCAKDGTRFEAEVTWTPSVFNNRQVRVVMVQDVGEKLRRAQHLEQSRRLESLGELAGGVAHDFNNLLAVILNFNGFVKERVAAAATDPDPQHWKPVLTDVQRIERAAESAARLTRQLLAFARREVVQPRPLDVNTAVRELEPLLLRTLGEQIELAASLDSELPPVMLDPGHLEQVLANLAVNARDAMPDGGSLTITTKSVDVDEAYAGGHPGLKPGRFIELVVSDSGIGMSAETLRRAFEPFFTTKPKGRGTGLGLATVYGIVAQASGYVSLYSEPGRGTRVRMLLPATDQLATPMEEPTSSPAGSASESVLVVEDDADLREVVSRMLGRAGYRVRSAANGEEALGLAGPGAEAIDLLVTDVVMPRMSGKDLAQRLTELRPGLRVLFMSGYAQPGLGPMSSLEPGVVLLEKPFSEQVLLARVRSVLEG